MPVTSSSTTTSPRGRPKNQRKADRRLERELSQREFIRDIAGDVRDLVVEFTRAAKSNPVVGVVGSIAAADFLFRTRLLSPVGYLAALGSIAVIEGAQVGASLANAIANDLTAVGALIKPFNQGATVAPENLLAPTANAVIEAEGKGTATQATTLSRFGTKKVMT